MPIASFRARRCRVAVSVLVLALVPLSPARAGQAVAAERLDASAPVERALAGGEAHAYTIDAAANQVLSVVVDQRGIDVVVTVVSPSGTQLAEVDSPNGAEGPEPFSLVTEESGAYRVGVRSLEKTAAAGRYEIEIVELRAATPNDKPLIASLALYNQSVVFVAEGRYQEALSPAEQAAAIREKTVGPDDPLVADAVEQVGFVNLWLGSIPKAEPLYLRALAIREKALGPEDRATGLSLYRLGALYLNKGDYEKAEGFYRRALAIYEKVLGPESADTARVVGEMGYIYQVQNDATRAEPFYERALAIREKTTGANSPETATSLMNVAWVHFYRDELATAEPLYRRALAIREATFGPSHPLVAEPLKWLSALAAKKGDLDEAVALGERALAIYEKALGPDHPDVATGYTDLATLYVQKKDFAKAEADYRRALASKEKSLGPNHPFVAHDLVFLGYLYNETAQYAKAEPLLQRALAIYEKTLGPDSILAATALNDLAFLYAHTGEVEKAGPLYERELAIQEKAFGPDHPDVGGTLANLTGLFMRTGDAARAVRTYARSTDVTERTLDLNLTTGSERQKLLYLETLWAETETAVSLNTRFAPDDPAARRLALLMILRRKGRALDAMAGSVDALRRRLDPGDRALLDRLTDARSRLSALVLKGSGKGDPATYRADVKTLEDQADALEAEISARSAAFRAQSLPVTIEAVQAAIPADAALVEFVRYRLSSRTFTAREKEWDAPRYAAYVLGSRGEPSWADLGDAATVDRASNALRDALRDPKRTDAKALARALDEQVMRPVRALLGPTRRVLLSPDGELNLVPFAALVDERDAYLVERYSFTYLTSGRDLLRLGVRREHPSAAVIVADPTFGGPVRVGSERKLVVEEAAAGAPRLYFGPLPGTAQEARALRPLLPGATVLTRDRATETALKQVRGPRVLHVATHGFFLHGSGDAQPVENPLLRAGLGLAGANGRGSGGDDGVLTALEAASLDLWGTRLVVLSACDTGVGEVSNGEGVYGLRRALVIAGSESQVMSLWPVSDTGTRELMTGYYTGLRAGGERGEELRQVQLRMLRSRDRRSPYYWASFIESGAWGRLDAE